MPTATAMCTRIRVADGKNTTTEVGTAYRTPDRHGRSTPNSRRVSGAISAPLPPLGAREAGAAALVALIVVREAVGLWRRWWIRFRWWLGPWEFRWLRRWRKKLGGWWLRW